MPSVQPGPAQALAGRSWRASLQDLLATRDSHHDEWLEVAPGAAATVVAAPFAAHADQAADPEKTEPASAPTRMDTLTRGWTQRRRRARSHAVEHRLEQRSLFGEILDWMFAPMLLLWPLSVVVTFLLARSLADVPFDRALYERTEALARQAAVASDAGGLTLPKSAADFVAAGEDDTQVYLQVIAPRGRLLAGQVDLPPPRLYDYPEPGRIKLRTATYRGNDVRIGYVYLDDGQADDGAPMLVQVAETLDKRTRLANEIIKGVIFPQFMILPVAITLVWFGLSRGLAPLKSMQRRIRNRSPDDLSPIDPRGAPDEIAPLIDAFNDLLERLGRNVEGQRRFIAAAAHQMKTPLAGLRTQSELALRQHDPTELRRSLELIALGSQRASHVVSQLLALARTENLLSSAPREPIELTRLAREAVTEWVPLAVRQDIDLGFESDERRIVIAGHALLLREMINNLVDNALRYTPRGGAITVRVDHDDGQARIVVEDSGPGIPQADRELVFERFYRVLGTNVDGSGLGLAIVREIVDQHQGSIEVTDAQPGQPLPGARFTARFATLPA